MVTTAVAFQVMTGMEMEPVLIFLGIFTIVYTMLGGIEAVVWTNAIQGFMIVGSIIIVLGALFLTPDVGGASTIISTAWEGGRFNLGTFEFNLDMLYDTENTSQWLFIVAFILGWSRRYMCDQHMVQRYLIARSDKEARSGALWGAISCVPIWLSFMFIGGCLWGYYQASGATPPEVHDHVMPHFIVNVLPIGVVGIILAAVLAASMSSISADLNSLATVATSDYFKPLYPKSKDQTQLNFGRGMVLAAGITSTIIGYLLLPSETKNPLMERAIVIASIISGGALGLFLLGFLTRRATARGCYVGIAACILFSTWALLTNGGENRTLDLGFNYEMKPILIGLFSNTILFVVGYVSSFLLGGKQQSPEEHLGLASLANVIRKKESEN